MTAPFVTTKVEGWVGTVTLNRPDVHNAFNADVIAQLHAAFRQMAADGNVRAVLLTAEGKSFSAGGDLGWMKVAAGYTHPENVADAQKLGDMLHALATLPKLTIALVQGAAFGGGVGLAAACDVALGVKEAVFSLSETRLGLIPAVISPYVLQAIGARAARRYFLTAERFDAATAYRLGLLSEVVDTAADLRPAADRILKALSACAPGAVADAKALIGRIADRAIDGTLVAETARVIADRRATPEAKEGLSAFLEKRKPSWEAA